MHECNGVRMVYMGYLDNHVCCVPSNQGHEETMRERLTSRKFGVLLTLIAISVYLARIGVLGGVEWAAFAGAIFTVYVMGNIYQKKNNV